MYFQHSGEIWRDFPELVPGIVFAEGITRDLSVGPPTAKFIAVSVAFAIPVAVFDVSRSPVISRCGMRRAMRIT